MKFTRSFLGAVLFTSVMGGAISNAIAPDGVLSKDELTTGNYCHQKFTPMTTQSLDSENPTLTNSGTSSTTTGHVTRVPLGKIKSKSKSSKRSIV
jgi:hypothetical protein